MPKLRAIPNANFYIGSKRYSAGPEGVIDAAPEDVPALLRAGCVSTSPWQVPVPQTPAAEPAREPPRMRMKAKPHAAFALSGRDYRYYADAEGFIEARAHDVRELERAGAELVEGAHDAK